MIELITANQTKLASPIGSEATQSRMYKLITKGETDHWEGNLVDGRTEK